MPPEDELSILEQELLMHARKLSTDDLKKLIALVKALADLDNG